MRKYPICAILGASFLLGSFSIALAEMSKQQAASTEHQHAAPADFSGLWMLHPSPDSSTYFNFAFNNDNPPMTPWGET